MYKHDFARHFCYSDQLFTGLACLTGMRKIKAVVLFICLFGASCEYHDLGLKCYKGKIIMSTCCTGSTFINIESPWQIGIKTKLNGQEYGNVIQVPGYIKDIDIYMNLRTFNRDRDYNLFPPISCYCLIVEGMDVPLFVATAYSDASCPS